MRRSLLPLAALTCLGLTGCAERPLEQDGIQVFAAPTSVGTGWVYRQGEEVESILPGSSRNYDVPSDAAALRRIWDSQHGAVSVGSDASSDYIVIRLDDRGTGKSSLLVNVVGWDQGPLRVAMEKSLPIIGTGTDIAYSVHLVTLEDDKRPGKPAEVVAQIRLRQLADSLMQAGVDPRVITGQVIPRREDGWTLAFVLRPYRFGEEGVSRRLVSPREL